MGKTSLLSYLKGYKLILFDDLGIRTLAEKNPALFFEQFKEPLILDEARRLQLKTGKPIDIDVWITGSNQALLQKAVRESLAGRANYYSLNTLSVHELKDSFNNQISLNDFFSNLTSLRERIFVVRT